MVESYNFDGDSTFDEVSFTWTYDNLGRLIKEAYDRGNNGPDTGDYVTDYTFDLTGNRLTKVTDVFGTAATGDTDLNGDPDITTTYTYDANDRLLTEIKNNAGALGDTHTTYTYGPSNGETQQTGKTVREGLTDTGALVSKTTYEYNAQGRLSKVTIDSNGDGSTDTTTTYTYNDNGIRVEQAVTEGGTTTTTEYLFDPMNPTGFAQVLEQYVNDTLHHTFTLGHDVIAQQSPTQAAGNTLTFLQDGHGSTRALLNEAAQIIERYAYDAYGNHLTGPDLTGASAALTTLLYSGEWTTPHAQQYLRARFYDPSTGRFNRLDPFAGNTSDPQSLHKYLYTHANPVMGVDPTGMFNLIELTFSIAQSVADYATDVAARVAPGAYIAAVRVGFIALRAYQIIPAVLNGLLIGSIVLDVGFQMIDKLTANTVRIRETAVYPVNSGEVTATRRGVMIEEIAGANIRGTVKGVDDFRQGIATQIKSYRQQNSQLLLQDIERDLRDFQDKTSQTIRGKAYDGRRVFIRPRDIRARQLLVALPENTQVWRDSAFMRQLQTLSNQYKIAIRPTLVRLWTVRR